MKFRDCLILCVCTIPFLSCGDKGTDTPKAKANGVENGLFSSSAFTFTANSTFNNLTFDERTYGSFGVLYCETGSDSKALIEQWAGGSNDPLLNNALSVKRTTTIYPGGRIEVTVDGLLPNTPYTACCFMESEDGKTRKIGAIENLSTKKFEVVLNNPGADNVKYFSALLQANISGLDPADRKYCSAGFIISEEDEPDMENGTLLEIFGTVVDDDFSMKAGSLSHKSKYNYRPILKILTTGEYCYGEVGTFTTRDYDENIVDMGTSVLWSRYLLGAEEDHAEGDLYRWGETEPLKAGVPYVAGSSLRGKEVNLSGTEYDPVTHRLGGKWRMPTSAELQELVNSCGFSGKSMKNIEDNYLIVKSAKTGKIINLPQTKYAYCYGDNYSKHTIYNASGSFNIWSADMSYREITETGYYILDNDKYEALLLDPNFDGSISSMVAAGALELRTETYTVYSIDVFEPNNWLDYIDYYNSGEVLLNDGIWLMAAAPTTGLYYGYSILPVRDRD